MRLLSRLFLKWEAFIVERVYRHRPRVDMQDMELRMRLLQKRIEAMTPHVVHRGER